MMPDQSIPVFDSAVMPSGRDAPSDEHSTPVVMERCAGYVVVSRCVGNGRFCKPGKRDYEHYDHLNDAADMYTNYVNGEHPDWIAVGIFPCDERGMPIDKPLDPHTLTKLVRETRAA
jgi:hypothetical protein